MKIAILVQNLARGGIQRLAVDEANECVRRGHEVWVITFEREAAENSFRDLVRIPADHLIVLPYARMRDVGSFFSLTHLLKRIAPDVLLTHHWFSNTVGRLAGFIARVPNILSFEHSVYDAMKPKRQFFYDRILQYLSNRIIAVSDTVRDSLVRNGIQPERVSVVPDGIDLSAFPRGTHDTLHTPPVFLFVGRLVSDKCVDVLLRARAKESPALLRIAGDGPERGTLEALAEELGVKNRVEFLGTRRDISALIADSDCLILPSRREGFGLVLVEALASGIPVIASALPSLWNIVRNGENGLLVPPDDVSALQTAMDTICTDPILFKQLASRAHESAAPYTIERHVDAVFTFA